MSLSTPFGPGFAIPPQIDEERLINLTIKIRADAGTLEDRDEIAHGFFRLAVYIASVYARQSPDLSDDYVQCSVFGLVKGLEDAKKKLRDDNMTPYLTVQMHSMCRRFQAKERLFGYSASNRGKLAAKGRNAGLPNRVPFEDVKLRAKSRDNVRDLQELLDLAIRSEEEREIIELRKLGFNDGDIAELLGFSNSYVAHRRKNVGIRFNRLNS